MAQALTNDFALPVQTQAAGGWTEMDVDLVWSYSSADAPSFVISVNDDLTDDISLGWRIRAKQDAGVYVYGIVTKIELSGGSTLFTIYGGTDYTFADESITSVAFSPVKAPFGFPLDPEKWTVIFSDSTSLSQSSPVSDTWYNPGGASISVPIGSWNVSYRVHAVIGISGTNIVDYFVSLSTSNNSGNDSFTMSRLEYGSAGVSNTFNSKPVQVVLTSKTTYYLTTKSYVNTYVTSISFGGTIISTTIQAVSAYL